MLAALLAYRGPRSAASWLDMVGATDAERDAVRERMAEFAEGHELTEHARYVAWALGVDLSE